MPLSCHSAIIEFSSGCNFFKKRKCTLTNIINSPVLSVNENYRNNCIDKKYADSLRPGMLYSVTGLFPEDKMIIPVSGGSYFKNLF